MYRIIHAQQKQTSQRESLFLASIAHGRNGKLPGVQQTKTNQRISNFPNYYHHHYYYY